MIRIDDYASFKIEDNKVQIEMGNLDRENLENCQYERREHLEYFYRGRIVRIFETKDDCSNIILEYDITLLIVSLGIKRRYFILDKIREIIFIPLSNKRKNIVDYGITELLNLYKIQERPFHRYVNDAGCKYVMTSGSQSLHEIIFGRKARVGYNIDHENVNGLDNRSSNLRELTFSQNAANLKIRNEYRGIEEKNNRWRARIMCKDIIHPLGIFSNKEEAAKQFDIFSVHLFSNTRSLNQIDGKNSLSNEEIEEIKNNPEKYDKLLLSFKKNRKLPKNIRALKTTHKYERVMTRFFIEKELAEYYLNLLKLQFPNINKLSDTKIEFDPENGYFFKAHMIKNGELNTLKELADKIDEYIIELDEMVKQKLVDSIDKYRNDKDEAIIKSYDGKINQYIDLRVCDSDWKEFIHYASHINGGYPANSLGQLHIVIFKKHFPEEYKNKTSDETVDHDDTDKTNLFPSNLRLANKSLQAQNRKVKRHSLIEYTGVHVRCGKFFAVYKRKKDCAIETVEGAARAYNKMALADDKRSRVNIVPDTQTRTVDLFSKEKLLNVDIMDLQGIDEIREIIRINNWKKDFNIAALEDIKTSNVNIFKKKIIEKLKQPDVMFLKIKSQN